MPLVIRCQPVEGGANRCKVFFGPVKGGPIGCVLFHGVVCVHHKEMLLEVTRYGKEKRIYFLYTVKLMLLPEVSHGPVLYPINAENSDSLPS